ncbi:hypothetical protein D3C75_885300 [compost metagenome]
MADKVPVNSNTVIIDLLVKRPHPPFPVRYRIPFQPIPHRSLYNHILPVVVDVLLPALRIMVRMIAEPATVDLRRLAGHAEVFNQGFALGVLLRLFAEAKSLRRFVQRSR